MSIIYLTYVINLFNSPLQISILYMLHDLISFDIPLSLIKKAEYKPCFFILFYIFFSNNSFTLSSRIYQPIYYTLIIPSFLFINYIFLMQH